MKSVSVDSSKLAKDIRAWSKKLGFDEIGITNTELSEHEAHLLNWLAAGYHGEMHYMDQHGTKRSRPEALIPGTIRIISTRMNYQAPDAVNEEDVLSNNEQAYISRYALGRDYHKVIRKRLQKLADKIAEEVGPFGYRAFVDSAPVLEKALAEKAGLGWMGKHTNLINKECGSWFFLGELYTDLPLPIDKPVEEHCGTCNQCIDVCPTQAIIAPYKLDARRCISYHTIELKESIPIEFRKAMGNRIYGCDDCQLVCPWNKFAKPTDEADFRPRHALDDADLTELMAWTEEEWSEKTEGSAIRRIGFERWQRNLAVALGNAKTTPAIIAALSEKKDSSSQLVRDHVEWALRQHAQDPT